MENIGGIISAKSIADYFKKEKINVSVDTVLNYIEYIINSMIVNKVNRYDIRGKKYLESSEKFYLCDTGIRYAVLGSRNMDYGRVYENIVCIELLRRGYDVYVGKLYQKEISGRLSQDDHCPDQTPEIQLRRNYNL